MNSFRILHLSDVHFGCPDEGQEQVRITDALARAAQAFVRKNNGIPDIVIFSGDLAFSAAREQFDQGTDWLRRVIGNWDCPVFVVPGNHDMIRPAEETEEYVSAFALRATARTKNGYRTTQKKLLERPHMDSFCEWHFAKKLNLGLVSDWSKSRLACASFASNKHVTAQIIGLNTTLASLDDDDFENLVADVGMLNSLLQPINTERELTIVISHHPIKVMPGIERWLHKWNDAAFALLLAQATGPHLYLHGHVHESKGVTIASNDGRRIFTYGAGAAYQGSQWPQHFAFLDIDLAKKQIRPTVFKYHTASGEWLPDPSQSRPVLAILPAAGAARGSDEKLVSRKPKTTARPLLDVPQQLDALSDQGVSRYLPAAVAGNEACFARLLALFDELTETTLDQKSGIPDAILAQILSDPHLSWSVVGDAGSGKSEFLAGLFWLARRRPMGSAGLNPRPVFLDLEYWQFDAGAHHERLLSALTTASKSKYVVFICGSAPDHVSDPTGRQRLIKQLTACGHIVVAGRHERRGTGRPPASNSVCMQTPSLDASLLDRFLDALSPLVAAATSTWKTQAATLVSSICRAHNLPISMFLVRECAQIASSHPSVTTFSEVLQTRWLLLTEGDAAGALLDLSTRAFSAFRNRAQSAMNRHDRMLHVAEHSPPGMRQFLSSHASVEHWLVAHRAQQLLERLGKEAANVNGSDKNDAIEICRSLELVYPVHVNAFAKELFAAGYKFKRAELTAALKTIFQTPSACVGRLLRGHACYLAGRLPKERARDFIPSLLAVIANVEQDLNENKALRTAVELAHTLNATAVSANLKVVAAAIFGNQESPSVGEYLHRVRRELLLLQRSAYISLAYLGESEPAKNYIHGLLTDSDKDDMNRGFHLEYYGDIEYQPGNPLLSTDNDLVSCNHAMTALFSCLCKETTAKPLAAIQAVTLASLARHRHAHGELDKIARVKIQQCIVAALNRHSDSREVRDFLQAAAAELALEDFVVERYVDGLYELKYQRRAGWGTMQPPESVAAHSYFVELLAKLFVPATLPYRSRVLQLVALHDLGEAITGDIPHPDRREEDKQKETRVVKRIAHLGALVGSPELLSLAEDYNVFEGRDVSDATATAQDLDRLDLLIQLMRYRRENPSMPRYDDFRRYVEPAAFQSKIVAQWATRFLKYFDEQMVKNVNRFSATAAIWPEPLNWVRI
jgi:5'-deoxynucleotidase YfbR-like HD superfamily hydrolase/predicted MPP superfamily phosphohydrolase